MLQNAGTRLHEHVKGPHRFDSISKMLMLERECMILCIFDPKIGRNCVEGGRIKVCWDGGSTVNYAN